MTHSDMLYRLNISTFYLFKTLKIEDFKISIKIYQIIAYVSSLDNEVFHMISLLFLIKNSQKMRAYLYYKVILSYP